MVDDDVLEALAAQYDIPCDRDDGPEEVGVGRSAPTLTFPTPTRLSSTRPGPGPGPTRSFSLHSGSIAPAPLTSTFALPSPSPSPPKSAATGARPRCGLSTNSGGDGQTEQVAGVEELLQSLSRMLEGQMIAQSRLEGQMNALSQRLEGQMKALSQRFETVSAQVGDMIRVVSERNATVRVQETDTSSERLQALEEHMAQQAVVASKRHYSMGVSLRELNAEVRKRPVVECELAAAAVSAPDIQDPEVRAVLDGLAMGCNMSVPLMPGCTKLLGVIPPERNGNTNMVRPGQVPEDRFYYGSRNEVLDILRHEAGLAGFEVVVCTTNEYNTSSGDGQHQLSIYIKCRCHGVRSRGHRGRAEAEAEDQYQDEDEDEDEDEDQDQRGNAEHDCEPDLDFNLEAEDAAEQVEDVLEEGGAEENTMAVDIDTSMVGVEADRNTLADRLRGVVEATTGSKRYCKTGKSGCKWRGRLTTTQYLGPNGELKWRWLCTHRVHSHSMSGNPRGFPSMKKLAMKSQVGRLVYSLLWLTTLKPSAIESVVNFVYKGACIDSERISTAKRKQLAHYTGNDMTPLQAALKYLQDSGRWKIKTHISGGVLNRVFFVQQGSMELLHQYPWVFQADCTYNLTNHGFKLLQIVGITGYRTKFTAAYCLMAHEDAESFMWAAQRFKECFDQCVGDGRRLQTLITDNDQTMIRAFQSQFSPRNTHYQLCVWHIQDAWHRKIRAKVGAQASETMQRGGEMHRRHVSTRLKQLEVSGRMWAIINAPSEEAYDQKRRELVLILKANRVDAIGMSLMGYHETREKWCRAWTGQHFNAGYVATSMVEGAHATLKQEIKEHTRARFMLRVIMSIEVVTHKQVARWGKMREDELQKSPTVISDYLEPPGVDDSEHIVVVQDVKHRITSVALKDTLECVGKLLRESRQLGLGQDQQPPRAGLGVGLPGEERIRQCLSTNSSLQLSDYHAQWHRTRLENSRDGTNTFDIGATTLSFMEREDADRAATRAVVGPNEQNLQTLERDWESCRHYKCGNHTYRRGICAMHWNMGQEATQQAQDEDLRAQGWSESVAVDARIPELSEPGHVSDSECDEIVAEEARIPELAEPGLVSDSDLDEIVAEARTPELSEPGLVSDSDLDEIVAEARMPELSEPGLVSDSDLDEIVAEARIPELSEPGLVSDSDLDETTAVETRISELSEPRSVSESDYDPDDIEIIAVEVRIPEFSEETRHMSVSDCDSDETYEDLGPVKPLGDSNRWNWKQWRHPKKRQRLSGQENSAASRGKVDSS